MGRTAGYRRVSHVGGRKHLHSPDEQAEEIADWAKATGRDVVYLEPELDGKGDNPDRPILREAIDGIKRGLYDGVVVAYLSRAGRDLRLMLDLWEEVEAVGGSVYFAREKIDGSTPSGRLQRNLLASIAQHELEERRDGFERATKGAVEAGIWQRRQTPRGYDRDPETRGLVVNAQAASVSDAARDYLAGTPILALADRLGMTTGGVRYMLRNRVYLGELKVRSYVNEDAHDPILDRETFEAVQVKLDCGPRPPRRFDGPALLAGLVRCASCGYALTRGNAHRKASYLCNGSHSGGRCPRPTAISCHRLDPFVEAVALPELERLRVRSATGDSTAALKAAVRKAEADLVAYLEAVDAAGIGTSDAAAGMRSRRERVEEANERLRLEMARVPTLPSIEIGSEVWAELAIHDRNALLRSLLAAVVVFPAEKKGTGTPVADRVRVLRYGADASPPWPDVDGEDVLGMAPRKDPL